MRLSSASKRREPGGPAENAAIHGCASAPFHDPWFQSLPTERQTLLLSNARLRRYASGERVYRIGDAPDGFYGISSGLVRLVSYPQPGQELVAGVISEGWFGEVSMLDGEPRAHDAIASGEVWVVKVGLAAWQALVSNRSEFLTDLTRLSCAHIRRQMNEVDALMTYGSEGRLSRLLLQLSKSRSGATGLSRVELDQTTLANLTGVSRQRVNKLLRLMEAAEMISIGYCYIDVLDPARLTRADFS
jgi:CRP/FNR family transcriptional regulator, cyclic AMP receptor protein